MKLETGRYIGARQILLGDVLKGSQTEEVVVLYDIHNNRYIVNPTFFVVGHSMNHDLDEFLKWTDLKVLKNFNIWTEE